MTSNYNTHIEENDEYLSEKEKTEIFNKNCKLISYVINKLGLIKDYDEFYDIGLIGFVNALNSYKKNLNISISTYFCKCIKHEILQELRKKHAAIRGNGNKELSINEIIIDKNGNYIEFIETIQDKKDIEETICTQEIISYMFKFIDELTPTEKTVIEHRYGLNNKEIFKQATLAKLINKKQAQVSKIEKKALQKLRKMMIKNDICI